MAANTIYITAGLPVSKDEDVDPGAGVNTVYVTAGLSPEILASSISSSTSTSTSTSTSEEVLTGLLLMRELHTGGQLVSSRNRIYTGGRL